MTDNIIPLAGVIGQPVSQSKSPKLFSYWLSKYDIPGHYVPLDIKANDLAHVLGVLPKMGFRGVNVTIPHKERVLEFADIVTDRAAIIGAANTLTFQSDGKLSADNTDGFGFISNLEQEAQGWVASDGPALVLGAGGAARGVIAALLQSGAPKVFVSNRTKARAEALRSHFGAKVDVIDWNQSRSVFSDISLLANSTSLGMTGKEQLKLTLDKLPKTCVVTDLVYTPLETQLLRAAREKGCVVVDGLGMLLQQAIPGFERWFNHKPEVDEHLRRALLSE